MTPRFIEPALRADPVGFSRAVLADLETIVGMDSHSKGGTSPPVDRPSTECQKGFFDFLQAFFESLRFTCERVANAAGSLIVHIRSNLAPGQTAPTLALVCHGDTSEVTRPSKLYVRKNWDGIGFVLPDNPHVILNPEFYPGTVLENFVGEDLVHGTGVAPFGLDDKLGISYLMRLARILDAQPEILHGDIFLVIRPDEELGRRDILGNLADRLKKLGVQYIYTIDGIDPFEFAVENFDAEQVFIDAPSMPFAATDATHQRRLTVKITGVQTHGSKAKAERHIGPVVVATRALAEIDRRDQVLGVTPADFRMDLSQSDVYAEVDLVLSGREQDDLNECQRVVEVIFGRMVAEHFNYGARVVFEADAEQDRFECLEVDLSLEDAFRFVHRVMERWDADMLGPLLSEDSEGTEGYSNPYTIRPEAGGWRVFWRMRDYTPEKLEMRRSVIFSLADEYDLLSSHEVQYANARRSMTDEDVAQLRAWAEAAVPEGRELKKMATRGGTMVDEFLELGIPTANLGTGYFAPESAKECTTGLEMGDHAHWVSNLVQAPVVMAAA